MVNLIQRVKNSMAKTKSGKRSDSRKEDNRFLKGIVITLLIILGVVVTAAVVGFDVGGDRDSTPSELTQAEVDGELQTISSELYGKSATLKASVYDVESDDRSQVATTIYVWAKHLNTNTNKHEGEYEYIGSFSSNASENVDLTGFVVGDMIKAIAFDSTYHYGIAKEKVISLESSPIELDTSKGSTSQSLSLYDEDGLVISDNITVGTTNYIMDKLRIQNADDKSLWETKLVGFDYAENTNISEIRLSGAKAYTEQVKRLKNVEEWYSLSETDTVSLNDDNTRHETGTITIVPDGDNVASETFTVYVIDMAPYLTVDKQLAYGVQDDTKDQADVGIADKSLAITLI